MSACSASFAPRFSFGVGASIASERASSGAAVNATLNAVAFSCKVSQSTTLFTRPALSGGVDMVAPTHFDPGLRPWIGLGLQAGVHVWNIGAHLPVEILAHGGVTSRGGRVGGSVNIMFAPYMRAYVDYTADVASFHRAQPMVSHQISAGFVLGL